GVPAEQSTADAGAIRGTLVDPDGRPLAPEELPLARAYGGEVLSDAEVVVNRPGRRARTFLANGRPIRDPTGSPLGAGIALHGITGRRRAERFTESELAVSRVLAGAASTEEAGRGVLDAVATSQSWAHAELWLLDVVGNALRPAATWTAPGRDPAGLLPDS